MKQFVNSLCSLSNQIQLQDLNHQAVEQTYGEVCCLQFGSYERADQSQLYCLLETIGLASSMSLELFQFCVLW